MATRTNLVPPPPLRASNIHAHALYILIQIFIDHILTFF